MELLCELLYLLTLLGVVALGVVHRAPRPALIAAGGLARPLVASWAMTPTNRNSSSGDSGSSDQWFVVVVATRLLLISVSIFDIALSSGICFGLAGFPCLQSRLGVPCMPFCSPGALVRQAEELRDVLHIVCG
jgi:hypothetical protein